MFRIRFHKSLIPALFFAATSFAIDYNAAGLKVFSVENDHFVIHYQDGLEDVARETGAILSQLYQVYRNTYGLTLPERTEVLVIDNDMGDGWAMDISNVILIAANGLDFTNLRGTHEYLRDVVTHEFAHIVSITSAHKFPASIPYMQFGYFNHPNEQDRLEALAVMPLEVLPPWYFEGIAQYESTRHGADRWDSHRDMILRTLALSKKLLPYDHMCVFAGRGDDFEKTYNHGLSMVGYISETYGYDKVVAILRESSKIARFNFDRSIKAVLGISARQLYSDWKRWLEVRYGKQVKSLGKQVYGRKINKDGYDNGFPRFSPDEKKIYFISNGKADYSYFYRSLYSYNLSDTVKDDKRIKMESAGIKGDYSICDATGSITYSSARSKKSKLPPELGALPVRDIYTDTLPAEKPKFRPFRKKTQHQITEKKSLFHPAFSPKGDKIVAARHDRDRYYVCLVDSSGKNLRTIYPDSANAGARIATIFGFDWSPDGRLIALSYIDANNRKVGVYDTLTRRFEVVCDTKGDERDPRFSPDGKYLYFSSDRTGIFNIYRLELASRRLARITNVSGGAFMPDLSNSGRTLVYTNYDENGFGIYMIDSVTAIEDIGIDSSFIADRQIVPQAPRDPSLGKARAYSAMPRKFLFLPTLLMEQAVTQDNNIFKGRTAFKAGCIINAFDPFALAAQSSGIFTGNELGGYLLIDPGKILRFIDPARGLISPLVDYDVGAFGTSYMLPLSVSVDYLQRGITGTDQFWDETEGALQSFPYSVTPYDASLRFSLDFQRGESMGGGLPGLNSLYFFGGLGKTDVTLILDKAAGGHYTYIYNIDKSWRTGLYWAFAGFEPSPTSDIAPRGMLAKVQYTLYNSKLILDENSFDSSGKEQYNTFGYNEVKAHLFLSTASPLSKKHVAGVDIGVAAADLFRTPKDMTNFPYYYQPEIWWQPGYAYYTREIKYEQDTSTTGEIRQKQLPYLKGVIGGNALAWGTFSYLFPLWPGSINRKVSLWYLDHLYGGFTATAAAAWPLLDDIRNRPRNDLFRSDEWLKSIGAQIRLESQMFSRFPFDVKLAWDWGMDRPAPVGGHRFSLGVGFGFDNWGMVESPELRPTLR